MKVRLQVIKLLGISALVWLGLTGWLNWQWQTKTLPKVEIGEVRVGNLTGKELRLILENKEKDCRQIRLTGNGKSVDLNELQLDKNGIIKQALKSGKGITIVSNFGKTKAIKPKIDEKSWLRIVQASQTVFTQGGKEARLIKKQNWEIENGNDALIFDSDDLKRKLEKALESKQCPTEIRVRFKHERKKLNQTELNRLKQKAKSLSQTKITLKINQEEILLDGNKLVSLLETDPSKGRVGEPSKEKIKIYLTGLKLNFDRPATNARFKLVKRRVIEFSPEITGRKLLVDANVDLITKNLLSLKDKAKTIELKTETIRPTITIKDSNKLGIVELLGRGESYYRHSIANRIYNVELAAKKIDGVLIAPGEEFSFNREVGEISRATGFKSAYIIKNGRTILGDGGGVCQVSTTVFRAALKAGLPITERWAHAYRVGYYEQNYKPGFDATVFAPTRDLKFKNDTGSYILLHSWYETQKRHLVIDLYGKQDGRKSLTKNFQVWDVVPPPPPIYQDDPNLPKGVKKQVDWRAWGAKVKFDYLVEKGGKVVFQKTFFSNYHPWQDVFLVGTREN